MPRGYPKSQYPEKYRVRSKQKTNDPFKGTKLGEQPDFRDTPESRMFADGPHNPKPLIVDGAQDRLPPGTDESSIGVVSNKKQYGIPEGWGHIYVTNTVGTSWENVSSVLGDNVAEYLEAVPGSFVVKREGGEKVKRRDTILVAIPPEQVERAKQEKELREKRWFKQLSEQTLGEGTDLADNRRASKDQLREMARQISDNLHRSGMIGDRSWSQGVPLDEAYRMKERRDGKGSVEAEMTFYREGNRSWRSSNQDQEPRRNTNRSISVPGMPTRRG